MLALEICYLVLLGLAGLCILGISLKVVFSLFKGQL